MEKHIKKINSTNWISVHIYYQNDVLPLLVYLRRLIKDHSYDIKCWFFIRYFDEGIHLRLRVLFKSGVSMKKKLLFFNCIEKSVELKRLQISTVKFKAYAPEIKRYGGIKLLSIAEEHFKLSSEYFLYKLKIKQDPKYLEELIILNVIILIAFELNVKEINVLNLKMYNYWLPGFKYYFPNVKNADAYFKRKIRKDIKVWVSLLQSIIEGNIIYDNKIKNWYKMNSRLAMNYYKVISKKELLNNGKYKTILPSLVHMNNNRFGISNYEEAYIFYITFYATSKLKLD
jgi:thiopeptide-type bacteriocin biosynthesis protein